MNNGCKAVHEAPNTYPLAQGKRAAASQGPCLMLSRLLIWVYGASNSNNMLKTLL
jgi:hypothetical protein